MIDPDLIPESTLLDIANVLFKACAKFYEDPENQKAYEAWAKERNKT